MTQNAIFRAVMTAATLLAIIFGPGCTSLVRPKGDPEIGVPRPGEPDPAKVTRRALKKKAVPELRFKRESVDTVLDVFFRHGRQLSDDVSVNFIFLPNKQGQAQKLKTSFRLRNGSLYDAISALCRDIGYGFRVEKHGVVIVHPDRKIVEPEQGKPGPGKPDPAKRVRKIMAGVPTVGPVCEYMSLQTAFSQFANRTRWLDPERGGVPFLLEPAIRERMNSVWLENLPIEHSVRYMCICAGVQYRVTPHAVIVASPGKTRMPKLPELDAKSKELLDTSVRIDDLSGPVSKAAVKLETSLEGLKLKVNLTKPQLKLKSGEVLVEPDVELSLTSAKMSARQFLQYFAFASGLKITSIREGVVTMTGKLIAVPAKDIEDETDAGEWEDE